MTSAKDKAVAKEIAGYREYPICCASCASYRSDFEEKRREGVAGVEVWEEEKNKRCSLHGFPVKKMAVCDDWGPK